MLLPTHEKWWRQVQNDRRLDLLSPLRSCARGREIVGERLAVQAVQSVLLAQKGYWRSYARRGNLLLCCRGSPIRHYDGQVRLGVGR